MAWVDAVQQCEQKSHDLHIGQLLLKEPMNVQLAAVFEDWDESKLTVYFLACTL
jgi:hypothetical protein